MALGIIAGPAMLLGLHAGRIGMDRLRSKVAGEAVDFQAKQRAEWLQTFSESMQLGPDEKTGKAYSTYTANRIQDVSGFSSVKIGEKTLGDMLKEAKVDHSDGVTAIQTALDSTLALAEETTEAKKTFEDDLAAINKAIQDPEFQFKPAELRASLYEIRQKAHQSIDEQHTHELTALEEKFANGEFRQQLKDTLGLEDEQIDSLRDDMVASLKQSQKKELDAFDKAMNDRIIQLHAEEQKERDRIHFLAVLYERNEEMRRIINDARAKKDAKEGQPSISLSVEGSGEEARLKKALFKGISLDDLASIQTATGRKLVKESDGYSMQLPNRLTSPLYYGGWNHKLKDDMMSMALAVKANGYQAISMSVEHPDPKHAMELARKAYEACREAGFESENITIQVRDMKTGKMKDMKADELFVQEGKPLSSRRQAIEKRAQQYEKEAKTAALKNPEELKRDEVSARSFRKKLEEHRAKVREQEREERRDEREEKLPDHRRTM